MQRGSWTASFVGVAIAVVLVNPVGAPVRSAGATDSAILSAGVIKSNDVPQGWTSITQSDPKERLYRGVADCKGIQAASAAARRTVPRRLSRDFSDPNSVADVTSARDTVYAFKNSALASRFLAAYVGSNQSACFQAIFQMALGPGQVSVTAVADLQGVGDQAAGYEVTIKVTDQLTRVLDFVGVRVGRAFVGFDFSDANQRLTQVSEIVHAVVDRLQSRALG